MRLSVPDPVHNIAAGTINARQPKNADVRPQRLPRQIGLCPRATPASADRRGFIHPGAASVAINRSEEHTSALQSLMRILYAVFCLKKTNVSRPKQAAEWHPLAARTPLVPARNQEFSSREQ